MMNKHYGCYGLKPKLDLCFLVCVCVCCFGVVLFKKNLVKQRCEVV